MIKGKSQKRFFNLPALGFIFASLLLGAILVYVTWHSIDRGRGMMRDFLLEEARALLRAPFVGGQTV